MSEFKTYREQLGLSVRAAAIKLAISPSYLSDIENGRRGVSQNVADKMIVIYGLMPHVHLWRCECGAVK